MRCSIRNKRSTLSICLSLVFVSVSLIAQEVPSDYQDVLKFLDRKGDFKAGVLKINVPRNDLKMTIQAVPTPTPFGFGGWLSMTKTSAGTDVMMGDLVLLQDEVNPIMSALLGRTNRSHRAPQPLLLGRAARLLHARAWPRQGRRPRPPRKTRLGFDWTRHATGCRSDVRDWHSARYGETSEDRWASW
jgi:hypothetical protein